MQFVWLDAATIVHAATGIAFTLWLVAAGGLLWAGRIESLEP